MSEPVAAVNRVNGHIRGFWTIEVRGSRAVVPRLMIQALERFRTDHHVAVRYSMPQEFRQGSDDVASLILATLETSRAKDLLEIFESFGARIERTVEFVAACDDLLIDYTKQVAR